MFTASALCALLTAANFQQCGPANVAEMVGRKLKMSTSYHVKMRLESRHHVAPNVGRNAYTASIWRHENKPRIDITEAAGDPPPPQGTARPGGDGGREITCHNCERPGYFLVTGVSPGNPVITRVVGFHKTPALAAYFAELDFDWRFLGMTNNTLHAYRLVPIAEDCRNYWTNPKRVTSGSFRDDRPGLISSLTTPNSQSETYFSVRDGYNPILHTAAYKF